MGVRNLTHKQLEALVWVAELDSFRKAAAHLNTSQPNISARIAGMEAVLGISLMQRDAGSVRMTAKGAEIVASAREVLRGAEKLAEIAGRLDLIEDQLQLNITKIITYT